MIIAIEERAGFLNAMGHRVPADPAGLSELKRRCLEGLSRLNDPPTRIWFRLPGDAPEPPLSALMPAPGLARALPREAEPPVEPAQPVAAQGRQGPAGRHAQRAGQKR